MRILLVGPYAPDGQFSIPAFVSTLESGLRRLGHEVESVAPQASRRGRALRPVLGRRTAFFDKFVAFPPKLRQKAKRFDVVQIAEHGYALYESVLRNKPHAVTCHDLIVAKAALGEIDDWPLGSAAKQYQFSILKHLAKCDRVPCASVATQEDVLRLVNRDHAKTPLLYDGFLRQTPKMESAEAIALLKSVGVDPGGEWLLHVGGNQPNKNKVGVMRIYAELQKLQPDRKIGLVMAGASPPEDALAIRDSLAHPELVQILNRPSDEVIRALYSTAAALLFPSTYEGFGLPIIEAQAAGCPVITTNRPPMSEVAGDAAILVEPEDPAGAANIIAERWNSIRDLIPCGAKNIVRFATDTMVAGYEALYREMV